VSLTIRIPYIRRISGLGAGFLSMLLAAPPQRVPESARWETTWIESARALPPVRPFLLDPQQGVSCKP
jgi:hypothetical protein